MLLLGLAALDVLQILDVSQNRLSGSLPQHWSASALVELDAHDNTLTGPLPAGLAELPRLSYLQLQALLWFPNASYCCQVSALLGLISQNGNQQISTTQGARITAAPV